MAFWSKKDDAPAEDVDEKPPSFPRMDEPATRSQMLAIAEKRKALAVAEHKKRVAEYPAKLAAWEASITQELTQRIPAMVEYLRRHTQPGGAADMGYYLNSTRDNDQLEVPNPPIDPEGFLGIQTDMYDDAITFLKMLDSDELTPEHRRILRRLHASCD